MAISLPNSPQPRGARLQGPGSDVNRLDAPHSDPAVSLTTAGAAERAWYGFHIKPETAGFPLNPIIRSVVIDRVKMNSPASAQQIRVGDEIVEAEGRIVPGTRAIQLMFLLNKEPGTSCTCG